MKETITKPTDTDDLEGSGYEYELK